jgi:hypothetical protein
MGYWELIAEEQEELEREKRRLESYLDDREIGLIGQGEVMAKLEEINKKIIK